MALIEFQNLLLQIYTNRELRAKLFAEPETFLKNYELTKKEKSALMKISKPPLEIFSRWLIERQRDVIRKLLSKASGCLIASSFYQSRPIIASYENGEIKITEIEEREFELLRKAGTEASFKKLAIAYLLSNKSSIKNLFNLVNLFEKQGWWGKKMYVL
jgi:hypothetical protein